MHNRISSDDVWGAGPVSSESVPILSPWVNLIVVDRSGQALDFSIKIFSSLHDSCIMPKFRFK